MARRGWGRGRPPDLATMPLSTTDHDRDAAGLRYVYPVLSRRARGLSIGINLNPNAACNWRCIYCQVPGLVRGVAPDVDLPRLEEELRGFVADVVRGDYLRRHLPEGSQRLNDVALSGNGEPTTCRRFDEVIDLIGRVLADFDLAGQVRLVLITNGSMARRAEVRRGLAAMARLNGEVWFKLDSATREGVLRLNGASTTPDRVRSDLADVARLCPTRIQTMVVAIDGEPPSPAEAAAYVAFLGGLLRDAVPVGDVMLYGLERPSQQPEAARLAKVPAAWLDRFARSIRELGLAVQVDP